MRMFNNDKVDLWEIWLGITNRQMDGQTMLTLELLHDWKIQYLKHE